MVLSLRQNCDLLAVGRPFDDLKKEIDLVHFTYTPRGIKLQINNYSYRHRKRYQNVFTRYM
jgi:hypothetical protein